MQDYDVVGDATGFLARRTPMQRHAIARLLKVDGDALAVLRWIVEQPDCDLATAAMTFWRLRTLGRSIHGTAGVDLPARNAVLETIAAGARAGRYSAAQIAWDGLEAWERTALIGTHPLQGAGPGTDAIPPQLFGSFGSQQPESARRAFLDSESGADDDLFDAMWRNYPAQVAVVDWLEGKSAEIWMAAIDDLRGGHNSHIYEWMLLQPECPTSVAGQAFWIMEPSYAARYRLDDSGHRSEGVEVIEMVLRRWKAGDLASCDLDFRGYSNPNGYRAMLDEFPGRADPFEIPPDLLDPARGRERDELSLDEDFDYWFAITDLAGGVARPLSAALAEWERAKLYQADARAREREQAAAAARPPGTLERLIYGDKFTGSESQIDHAWKRFNLVSIAGASLVLAMWRAGVPAKLTFFAFLALVAVVSGFQAFVEIGSTRRVAAWWVGVFVLSLGLAFLLRWIDKGVIG